MKTFKKFAAIAAIATLAPLAANADLRSMNDQDLSAVSGQGYAINLTVELIPGFPITTTVYEVPNLADMTLVIGAGTATPIDVSALIVDFAAANPVIVAQVNNLRAPALAAVNSYLANTAVFPAGMSAAIVHTP